MPFSHVRGVSANRRMLQCSCILIALSTGLCASTALSAFAQVIDASRMATLTLDQAIRKAITASPKVQAAAFGIEAAAGTEVQAGLHPNPEASLGVENLPSVGPGNSVAYTETTLGVSQLFEMGGKRQARLAVAGAGRQAAESDAHVARLDLIRDVTLAYDTAIGAQQSLEMARDLEAAANEVLGDVTKRVNAARDPLYQKDKAQAAYESAAVVRQNAQNALVAALQKLARFWAEPTVSDRLSGDGPRSADQPQPLAAYEARLGASPDLDRYRKVLITREAEMRLAEANAVPDITANTGIKGYAGTSYVAMVAGVSIPIPVFNQNQGEISRAGAEIKKAAQDLRQAELERSQELIAAWSQWQSAWAEANALRDRAIPRAESALSSVLDGYHRGAFTYLEVLDAQRTQFDLRNKYIDALTRVRAGRAQTERLAPTTQATGDAP